MNPVHRILRLPGLALLGLLSHAVEAPAQESFVNFETPQVHPLELTPGGLLLAVNTADGVLEVFDTSGPTPTPVGAVPVGYDPVSVRARTATEAWVVNHISDSVSIVDLTTLSVVDTLQTLDEPCDVVFAGTPERAFVSCSQANSVLVFDPASPGAAPQVVPIEAEDPRALAVSPDGQLVHVAIFESGNRSTILGGGGPEGQGQYPPNLVSDPDTPHGGVNPPPNGGAGFVPPMSPGLAPAPRVGLIVKQDAAGRWMDDIGGDWTEYVSGSQAARSGRPVGWALLDRDVATIDTQTLAVSYAGGLMNLVMALGVNPQSGEVTVVGTDGLNEVRFEPNLRGIFIRVLLGMVDPSGGAAPAALDLNDHLDYQTASVPQPLRDRSIGDPRAILWRADGSQAFVAGMGSNNVVVVGPAGTRVGAGAPIEVGQGPTGLAIDEASGRLFVLNRFDASVSVVDLGGLVEVATVSFHDATPEAVRSGRRHLYDTHASSGLGQASCASCHADARMDRLSWDLGDPSGGVEENDANCFLGNCSDWHPMKGPMLTQTLQDIIGKEPHHWRGDRTGLERFAHAFVGLQAKDSEPTPAEMQEFEDFLASIHFPPNPYRNFDNSLPTALTLNGHYTTGDFGEAPGQPLGVGDATRGLQLYTPPNLLDANALACVTCHTLPTGLGPDGNFNGTNFVPIPPGQDGERHHALTALDGSTQANFKISQLRNLHERTGFNTTRMENTAGFGYLHDGSIDSIERFIGEPVFTLADLQEMRDLTAFLLAFPGSGLPQGGGQPLFPPGTASLDAHAAVGAQRTVRDAANLSPEDLQFLNDAVAVAEAGAVSLVVHGRQGGEPRGWTFVGAGIFQSDRVAESTDAASLLAASVPGSELTMTVVPVGTEFRLGIDRDEDGFLNGDERDAGSDPANPLDTPLGPGQAYCFGDGSGSACPCGNEDLSGEAGCRNSTQVGGRLSAVGAASVVGDTVTLHATDLPAGKTALFFQGTGATGAGAGAPLGDGLLCASPGIIRLGVAQTDSAGEASYPAPGQAPVSVRGGASAGQIRRYQVWYRDGSGAPCGSGTNLTNGYEIAWQ